MTRGFRWCPHCGNPHDITESFCAVTGESIDLNIHKATPPRYPTFTDLENRVLDQRYRLQSVIGTGGMGVVYEAQDLVRRVPVAVKIVPRDGDRDAQKRLEMEASLAAELSHANISAALDFGNVADLGPYLVFERLYGETLGTRIKSARWLSVPFAAYVFEQILDGLEVAHSAQVIHRDLKPHNIFLAKYPSHGLVAKVLDFGLAQRITPGSHTRLTKPGMTAGTVQYMSPEQLSGLSLGPASDIFAVGTMLYEALTGRHPFFASTKNETKKLIMTRTPRSICDRRLDVPRELDALILACLSKSPSQRPRSAKELRRALIAATCGSREPWDEEPPSTSRPAWLATTMPPTRS